MSKYSSIEDAQKALAEYEKNLKEFEDEAYNITEEINKGKAEINSINNLCEDLRTSNYQLWSQSTMQERQVEEIEESSPSIEDIIGGIDLD